MSNIRDQQDSAGDLALLAGERRQGSGSTLPGEAHIDEALRTLSTGERAAAIPPLAETERRAIEDAIRICDGDVRAAASHLQVSPSTIYRKIAQWLTPRSERAERRG